MGDDAWLAAALGPSSGDAQDAQAGDDGWLAFAATHTFLFLLENWTGTSTSRGHFGSLPRGS